MSERLTDADLLRTLTEIYTWPSQAYWRYHEIRALEQIPFAKPILEIGCGSGQLTALLVQHVELALDVNPRSVEKARRVSGQVYGDIVCLDARNIARLSSRYGTVFANCVLEHIPGVDAVIKGAFEVLHEGGRLVITVPLREMNNHLSFQSDWYARYRQRQLEHVNLWSGDEWVTALARAGFSEINVKPYLGPDACKRWDRVDALGSLGLGRYQIAPIANRVAGYLVPKALREATARHSLRIFLPHVGLAEDLSSACAAVIVGRRTSKCGQEI